LLFVPEELQVHLAFIFFTAIAVYTQNLTGFALALVLLGLVGFTNIVPLEDAINAVTIVAMVNAAIFLYRRRPIKLEASFRPAIHGSLVGYFVGMGILGLVSGSSLGLLRTLLGLSIMGCALLLWRSAKPADTPYGALRFASIGAASGILGGLFSAPGPPLVYAAYRQPWPLKTIQNSLVVCFGIGALLRLVVMGATGQISSQAILLGVESLPVVLLITAIGANRKPPISRKVLQHLVCILLMGSGLGMLF